MLEKEASAEEEKKWEQKLNKDGVRVWIKKGGNDFSKEVPYVKTEIQFNGVYSMKKVAETVMHSLDNLFVDFQPRS